MLVTFGILIALPCYKVGRRFLRMAGLVIGDGVR